MPQHQSIMTLSSRAPIPLVKFPPAGLNSFVCLFTYSSIHIQNDPERDTQFYKKSTVLKKDKMTVLIK